MGKVEDKKRAKQIALLRSGYTLFVEKGVERTTVLEIALRAGMAKGTFYLYYPDKYAMRDALTLLASSKVLEEALRATEDKPAPTFEERAIQIADTAISAFIENKDLLRFMEKNLSWGLFKSALSQPLSANDRALLGTDMDIHAMFLDILKRYEVHVQDPECLIFMLVELIGSTAMSTILDSDPVPMSEFRPHLFAGLRGIIRSEMELGEKCPSRLQEKPS